MLVDGTPVSVQCPHLQTTVFKQTHKRKCFNVPSDSDVLYSVIETSVLPKQFLGKDYNGWFAIAFPAVFSAGIWNLARVLLIAIIVFTKDAVGYLRSTN